MKNVSKNDRFWDAKTLSRYALCNEFTNFGISEKIGKSMPKWFPKVVENQQKSTLRAPMADLFVDLIDFGRC